MAQCWAEIAGAREALAVAVFLRCPTRRIRSGIADELAAFYQPPCGEPVLPLWPDVPPPEEGPPGGARVPARPYPPLLPPAAAAEEAVHGDD